MVDLSDGDDEPVHFLCEPIVLNEKRKAATLHWRTEAAKTGLIPVIDNLMLYRAIRMIATRRSSIERAGIVFACRISQASLADPAFFGDLIPFLALEKDKASALTLVIPHAVILENGNRTLDRLGDLAEKGLTFGLGDCTEPYPDLVTLGTVGFRFFETPIKRLRALSTTFGPDGMLRLARKRANSGVALCASGIRTQNDLEHIAKWRAELAYGDRFGRKGPIESLLADSMGTEQRKVR